MGKAMDFATPPGMPRKRQGADAIPRPTAGYCLDSCCVCSSCSVSKKICVPFFLLERCSQLRLFTFHGFSQMPGKGACAAPTQNSSFCVCWPGVRTVRRCALLGLNAIERGGRWRESLKGSAMWLSREDNFWASAQEQFSFLKSLSKTFLR